jgi:hypothetical protein
LILAFNIERVSYTSTGIHGGGREDTSRIIEDISDPESNHDGISIQETFDMKHLAALSTCISFVAAHGFVQNATIGGKEYDVRRIQPPRQLARPLT